MEASLNAENVLVEIRRRIEFHKRALQKLEQQESKIKSEINVALNLLSEEKISVGPTGDKAEIITGDEQPNRKSAKDAVLSVLDELQGIFTLADVYTKVMARGIMVENSNAYKKISSALISLVKSGKFIEKVEYGKYKAKELHR